MDKRQVITKSIDYIIEHLDQEISIETVADQFHFSKYYFCRVFKEVTGESVYAFIKRLKMDQSAIAIKLEKDKKITEIGMDFGYSSSNYSSAFSKHHQVSPYEFRQSGSPEQIISPFYPNGVIKFETFEEYDGKITVQEIGDFYVIYERMVGNYIELRKKWFAFIEEYQSRMRDDTLLLERFYNDPAITEVDHCIYDLCMTVDPACGFKNTTTIQGGRFLVYRYEGAIQNIFYTIQGIFSVWMPKSGYKMDKRYGLNLYRNIDQDKGYVTMDLCIPVK